MYKLQFFYIYVSNDGPLDDRIFYAKLQMNFHVYFINPLEFRGNYSAISNNMKLVHWPWWVGCYIWYSKEGTGRGHSLHKTLLAVPNVTAHQSTASVPITVLVYNGLLLCGFNVSLKG